MLHWYVVHSKPRKEVWVFDQFTARQIDAYYPCFRELGSSPLHKPKPYFPGYLFINVDIEAIGTSLLQWIPGSLGLISFGGDPAIVSDQLIQKIRHHVDGLSRANTRIPENLKHNDEIAVHSGPFAGYTGIFDSYLSGQERARIFLKYIQNQQLSVELPVRQIMPKKQFQARF